MTGQVGVKLSIKLASCNSFIWLAIATNTGHLCLSFDRTWTHMVAGMWLHKNNRNIQQWQQHSKKQTMGGTSLSQLGETAATSMVRPSEKAEMVGTGAATWCGLITAAGIPWWPGVLVNYTWLGGTWWTWQATITDQWPPLFLYQSNKIY